jgi:hypothetical protein
MRSCIAFWLVGARRKPMGDALTVQATTLEISAASAGVRRPSATAFMTADMAWAASRAVLIGGKGNATNRFLSGGQIRSMHSRSATASPSRSIWMAFCVSASAWPSGKTSHAGWHYFATLSDGRSGYLICPSRSDCLVFRLFYQGHDAPNIWSKRYQKSRTSLNNSLWTMTGNST